MDTTLKQAQRDAAETAKRRNRQRWRPLWPAVIFLIVMTQIPFAVTIFISFTRWNIMYPNDRAFGTLENYKAVLKDRVMQAAMINTVVIVVFTVIACLIIALILALLLNRKFFGRGVVRTMLITPFLIMPMASSLIWKHLIYNPQYGLLRSTQKMLGTIGIDVPFINMTSDYPMAAVIITLTWTWIPFMFLILLAGLQGQDSEILEAASVDGATRSTKLRYITLPLLRPYVELCVVLGVIYLLNTYDQVFSITQGGPGAATTNLPYAIYLTAFRGYDYGEASAAGVLVVIASVIIAAFGLRLVSSLATDTITPKGGKAA